MEDRNIAQSSSIQSCKIFIYQKERERERERENCKDLMKSEEDLCAIHDKTTDLISRYQNNSNNKLINK